MTHVPLWSQFGLSNCKTFQFLLSLVCVWDSKSMISSPVSKSSSTSEYREKSINLSSDSLILKVPAILAAYDDDMLKSNHRNKRELIRILWNMCVEARINIFINITKNFI